MNIDMTGSFAGLLKAQKQLRDLFFQPMAVEAEVNGRPFAMPEIRPATARLEEGTDFGSNPGNLVMRSYAPADLAPKAPLVVVLHGCLQTAQGFDDASGWSTLAREHGFGLLYPEQTSSNNSNLCFNWFRPSAVARDRGELESIRQMVIAMIRQRDCDPARIFVVGLSAGGAMASALLATYPDLFAGGAVVAGLPFGAARDAMTALAVMKSGAGRSVAEWGDMVRSVSPQMVRRPSISIWQGRQDQVVNPANADACVAQWLSVYGLDEAAGEEKQFSWGTRTLWRDSDSRILLSSYRIDDLGHAFPVMLPKDATDSDETKDRFIVNASIGAPTELVTLWGLRSAPAVRGRK